jgi:hypothetical protein
MVNLSETLFALAAIGALVTLATRARGTRADAKRLGLATLSVLGAAVALETYLQLFR